MSDLQPSKHATVRLAEFPDTPIPLIGVPPSATEQVCEGCGRVCHLSEIALNGQGKALCPECSEKSV